MVHRRIQVERYDFVALLLGGVVLKQLFGRLPRELLYNEYTIMSVSSSHEPLELMQITTHHEAGTNL